MENLTKGREFTEENYARMLEDLFVRFPSFQKIGSGAYKPGLDRMEFFDSLAGHPHKEYRTIHIAGTNGKGSVANMLAAVLAVSGQKVGLYTSPHILDFRERMRVIGKRVPAEDGDGGRPGQNPRPGDTAVEYIPEEYVWNYVKQWGETFDHLEMSFFEITTAMAFSWFAYRKVDVAVIETGLGGRLDSTNIITPQLSVITNIGLDHCDILGDTLPEIAFEKAGIIKPEVPAVIGESDPETDPVFERKVLYTNLPSPAFMGDRTKIMSLLTFADRIEPRLWEDHEEILRKMDLGGEYQKRNLRTVLAALEVMYPALDAGSVREAVEHTCAVTDFHGRWEKLSDDPYIICDIGHNAHGLKYNFHQLGRMLAGGECSSLIIVYGTVSDKDYDSVFPLMPENASYIFTNASSRRALSAGELERKYIEFCNWAGRPAENVHCTSSVEEALDMAAGLYGEAKAGTAADAGSGQVKPLVYIGGSTYVVAEAVNILRRHR